MPLGNVLGEFTGKATSVKISELGGGKGDWRLTPPERPRANKCRGRLARWSSKGCLVIR